MLETLWMWNTINSLPISAEPPKLTDYLSTIIAIAALAVASLAAWATIKTNANQAKQLLRLEQESKERREQEKRLQASQVSAYLEDNMLIFVCNESGLPIYDVSISYHGPTVSKTFGPYRHLDSRHNRFSPPGSSEFLSELVDRAILGKSYQSGFAPLLSRSGEPTPEYHEAVNLAREWAKFGLTLSFRDANNVTWCRNDKGELKETSPRPPAK